MGHVNKVVPRCLQAHPLAWWMQLRSLTWTSQLEEDVILKRMIHIWTDEQDVGLEQTSDHGFKGIVSCHIHMRM